MPTTTNYGWTTPADTDLVKDGASAIRTLGTAIDTTVFNNASAGIAKTIVDAKGDIIAATAADTVSRLAVGANNTVLTADSAEATGLKWALPSSGGITLLSTTTLTGTSTTVTSISQDYTNLYFIVSGSTTTSQRLIVLPNNNSDSQLVGTYYNGNPYQSGSYGAGFISAELSSTNGNQIFGIIYDYTSTSPKAIQNMGRIDNVGSSNLAGYHYQASAITSLRVQANNGTATITGTIKVYGVK